MESESLTQKRDMVKSLARNFNYKNSTLIARKGRETQDIEIKADDFSKIMGIQDGSEAVLDKEADNSLVEEAGAAVPQLSAEEDPVNQDPVIAELESKYCNVTKNGGYKGIAIKNVVNELKKTNDEDVTKQTFMLTAMHYIVCPALGGVLSKSYLDYVKDANSLDKQPWATIAMNDLKYGVKNFVDGKGAEKNIGGCTLFLQLFCMSLRGFHDSLDFSKIDEKMIEEFYMTWMIDNGSENKRRKLLADKIVNDMKSVANLIKAKSDLLDLDLLLNLDESIQESQKKISAAAVANDEIEGVEHLSVQDLEPQKWLNDNVINFYISELKMKLKDNSAHYHIFNTFFYVKLQRYFAEKDLCTEKGIVASPFEKVRRWWGRDNILKKNILLSQSMNLLIGVCSLFVRLMIPLIQHFSFTWIRILVCIIQIRFLDFFKGFWRKNRSMQLVKLKLVVQTQKLKLVAQTQTSVTLKYLASRSKT
ncbi:uncharacterized protein LOC118490373 [Helianthus annuus]|uniref:uncharacterized protein LOC118490373 n=1 Tax=Helianthus annuus TaxID=4232 RepID=UPI001652D17C|nr:uncharacterized protein LOC118490373 [Helianthus annuus]